MDDRSGLAEHHEGNLRALGLDQQGTEDALINGRASGFLALDDQSIRNFAIQFHQRGYRALMNEYLDKLREIESMVAEGSTIDAAAEPGIDALADWQGLTWQLSAAFADAMMFGQSIAVMNSIAYRAPSRSQSVAQ